MVLNDNGKIVADEGTKSAEIRDEIALDEFVVMPNHFHGIVIIRGGRRPTMVGTRRGDRPVAPTAENIHQRRLSMKNIVFVSGMVFVMSALVCPSCIGAAEGRKPVSVYVLIAQAGSYLLHTYISSTVACIPSQAAKVHPRLSGHTYTT